MMKTKRLHLLFGLSIVLTVTLFFGPAKKETLSLIHRNPAAFGGDSSGGSTGTRNSSGRLIHFDIYIHNPDFKDSYNSIKNYHLKNLTQQNIVYGKEQHLMLKGYAKDQYAVEFLFNRLELWQDKSPILTILIKRSLKEMTFFVVDDFSKFSVPGYVRESMKSSFLKRKREMELKYSIDIMNQPLPKELIPIAVYQYWQKAFSINAKIFDQLGIVSRQAVFLKEALRNSQYNYVGGSLIYNMDDSTLQSLVYKILLSDPAKTETLDDASFYRGYLEKLMKNDPRKIMDKVANICVRLKAIDLQFASKQYCEEQDSAEMLLSPKKMLLLYQQLLLDQSYIMNVMKKNQLIDFFNILREVRNLTYELPLKGFSVFDID